MYKIKVITVIILFAGFLSTQGQEMMDLNNLRDHDKVFAFVESSILDSNIDGILAIGSGKLKQSSSGGELKLVAKQVNQYLSTNGYESLEVFGNAGNSFENQFKGDGRRFKIKTFKSAPDYINETINPLLNIKLSTSLVIQLAYTDGLWRPDSIAFNDIEFSEDYDIQKHINDFLTDDKQAYAYATRVTIFKKEHFKLICQGDIEDLGLAFRSLKKVNPIEQSFGIDDQHYSLIFLQRQDIREDTSTTGKGPNYKWLEILFTTPDKILISDSYQYGFYELSGNSNLTEYIKQTITTFVDNGYIPERK